MSIIAPVTGLPGMRTAQTATPRIVFKGGWPLLFRAGGLYIDGVYSRDPGNTGDLDVLRPGLLMGKRTANNFYAPSILGVANGAILAGAVTITVSAAVVTELVRRIGASGTFKLTGPSVANGSVVTETITYSAASGTTITNTATANAFVTGSFIQPTDGSETPISLIPDEGGSVFGGIKVTDTDNSTNLTVQWPCPPIAGAIISSQILPAWPSDTSLQAWIMARLNGPGAGQFIFDHVY